MNGEALSADTEDRLARLVRLAGSDEGFFVLALHSFVESHARAEHPPLAYFDTVPRAALGLR